MRVHISARFLLLQHSMHVEIDSPIKSLFFSQSAGGAGTSSEDQEKLLTEALEQVKRSSFEMKTCLVGSLA